MSVPYARFVFHGRQAFGADVWSMGFSTENYLFADQLDMEQLAATALGEFDTHVWHSSAMLPEIPPGTFLDSCVASQYLTDGTLEVQGAAVLATPIPGTNGAGALPPECAEVISLRTPVPGARGRGRMYFPALSGSSVTNQGALQTAVQQNLVDSMRDFFIAWKAAPNTKDPCVVSQVGNLKTTVTSIRVGNVVDAQRRRRNTIPESYLGDVI